MPEQQDQDVEKGGGSASDGVVAATRAVTKTEQQEGQIKGAVEKALGDPKPPVFNTHSHAIDALFASQEIALKGIVADLDAKIAALQGERTDAMLAYSMLTAGRYAKEKGASG